MKYAGVAFFIFCLVTISCKTKEVASPKEFTGNQLWLTHGGGFAGTYKTYCLLDNGQLFKGDKDSMASNPAKGLDKNVVNQVFSNYETLGLGNEKVESYGNLNYSITMINKDGEKQKSIWGKGQKGAEKYQLFYDNIMNIIRLNGTNKNGNSNTNVVK